MNNYTPKHPFDGQVMTCQNCGRKERSNPRIESQWNHIEIDGIGFYICPQCWTLGKPSTSFTEWLAMKFGKEQPNDDKPADMSAGWEV